MIGVSLFGAGLIASIHAGNLARHPGAELRHIVDPRPDAAATLARRVRSRPSTEAEALDDPAVRAVVIASATRSHADLIAAAAKRGKAIFCEKPIDLDLRRTDQCLAAVDAAGVPFQIGFNRRFDPSFRSLQARIAAGEIGAVEQVLITSRDPEPETRAALASGGGVFREMTIHDFDMARFLLGEDPVELFALGSVLVAPHYAELGDFDTALFVLRTASGRQCHINNSVRAVYGYDQRVEVHGSGGMVQAANMPADTVTRADGSGSHRAPPPHFFADRYAQSYAAEMEHFLSCVECGSTPAVGALDGRKAMVLCEAAWASVRSGRLVPVRY